LTLCAAPSSEAEDIVAANAPATTKSRGKFTEISPIARDSYRADFEVLRVNKRLMARAGWFNPAR
jgi:hypothetical protein